MSPKLMWLIKFIKHITKRGRLLEMVLNKAIATRSSKENAITVARLDIALLIAATAQRRLVAVQARRLPIRPM